MAITEKVEMKTINNEIKSIYDSCHILASNGKLKSNDYEKRLKPSGLFYCEIDDNLMPVSNKYTSLNSTIPDCVIKKKKKKIIYLSVAVETGRLLKLNQSSRTLEEVQLNHIIADICLNLMNKVM